MGYYGRGYGNWSPYVPVASRRAAAERERRRLEKQGSKLSPVVIEGRTIAHTFWGQSWCQNLEGYGDFANRLPRGRTYVRNGSVIDLQIAAGEVRALVSGSSIYRVAVQVDPVPGPRWEALCQECASEIDSLVELLQGRFAKGVMERICRQGKGLFPSPRELRFSCSCPDWATVCKHVAAVLYGVGARLDANPELLFTLCQVDSRELVSQAAADVPLTRRGPAAGRVLVDEDLGGLFGVELLEPVAGQKKAAAAPGTRAPKGSKATEAAAAPKTRAPKGRKAAEAAAEPKTRVPKATKAARATASRPTQENMTKVIPALTEAPRPLRPKPARCLYPGCRLTGTVRDEGYCSVHGMMWRDGDIPGPGSR